MMWYGKLHNRKSRIVRISNTCPKVYSKNGEYFSTIDHVKLSVTKIAFEELFPKRKPVIIKISMISKIFNFFN